MFIINIDKGLIITYIFSYCMQLISAADVLRQRRKGEKVNNDDVEKVYNLFSDVNRCKMEMVRYEDWFLK